MSFRVDPTALSALMSGKKSTEAAGSRDFIQLLEQMRQQRQLDMLHNHQRASEKRAKLAEEDRQRRIQELYALISQLRSQISAGGSTPRLEAQLSLAKSQLFWLLCAIGSGG